MNGFGSASHGRPKNFTSMENATACLRESHKILCGLYSLDFVARARRPHAYQQLCFRDWRTSRCVALRKLTQSAKREPQTVAEQGSEPCEPPDEGYTSLTRARGPWWILLGGTFSIASNDPKLREANK